MNLVDSWVIFYQFRFQGLDFGVTSVLGLRVLTLSFLGLLSQSRLVWVISGYQGLYRGIFQHFRKLVCLGSLGVKGHRKWGKSTLRPIAVPTVPKPFLYLKWFSSYKGSKLGVLLFT